MFHSRHMCNKFYSWQISTIKTVGGWDLENGFANSFIYPFPSINLVVLISIVIELYFHNWVVYHLVEKQFSVVDVVPTQKSSCSINAKISVRWPFARRKYYAINSFTDIAHQTHSFPLSRRMFRYSQRVFAPEFLLWACWLSVHKKSTIVEKY